MSTNTKFLPEDIISLRLGVGMLVQLTLKNVQAIVDLVNSKVFLEYYDKTEAHYGNNYTYIVISWKIGDNYDCQTVCIGDYIMFCGDGIEVMEESQAERKIDFVHDMYRKIFNDAYEKDLNNVHPIDFIGHTRPVHEIVNNKIVW